MTTKHPTDEMIVEMRGWLTDCEWRDMTSEDIAELSAVEVLQAVERHYAGGVDQFVKDC